MNKQETKSRVARRRGGRERGYSMVELTVVALLLMIISAMAILQIHPALQQQQASSAMIDVASELRQARQMAITQRRQIQVQFIAPNQIVLTRLNINPGVVGTTFFDPTMKYYLTPGKGDTPDGFGATGDIVFGGIVGGPPTMMFQSDGTFVNTAGVPINGTIFIGDQVDPSSARAVTVLGATGRIKMYKNNANAWVQE